MIVFLWLLLGFILFLLSCFLITDEITVGDIFVATLGMIFGPLMVIGIVFAIVHSEIGEKVIFERKGK